MAEVTQPGRFTLPPMGDETQSALHESIMAQVRESTVTHDGKGNGRISVRLNPDELGELQINVRVENQRVKVEIVTENRTVRDALMGNLDTLKETLQRQNLNMERFDVATGGEGFGQGFRDERGAPRAAASFPAGPKTDAADITRERTGDDWGVAENSLVNLRL